MSKPRYFVVTDKPCKRMQGRKAENPGQAELWVHALHTKTHDGFQCLFVETTSGTARKIAKYLNEKGFVL